MDLDHLELHEGQEWRNILIRQKQQEINIRTQENYDRTVALQSQGKLWTPKSAINVAPHVQAKRVHLHPLSFYQANLMQQRINNVYNAELKGWHESRDKKIEQNVTNAKNRHNKERDLLNKKIQITVEDYNNKWRNDKISLQQRYNLQLK